MKRASSRRKTWHGQCSSITREFPAGFQGSFPKAGIQQCTPVQWRLPASSFPDWLHQQAKHGVPQRHCCGGQQGGVRKGEAWSSWICSQCIWRCDLQECWKILLCVKTYTISCGSCSQPRTLYSIKPGMGLEGEDDAVKRVFQNFYC